MQPIGDVLLKTGFVASEVIADQLAVPVAQEVVRMFSSTARAEVVNHGFERRKRRSAIRPDVGPVGFLFAWRKHLHRCFIGVNHALVQHRFTQCIDQRLESHPVCPTHWAKVERAIASPARPKIFSCRYSGK